MSLTGAEGSVIKPMMVEEVYSKLSFPRSSFPFNLQVKISIAFSWVDRRARIDTRRGSGFIQVRTYSELVSFTVTVEYSTVILTLLN